MLTACSGEESGAPSSGGASGSGAVAGASGGSGGANTGGGGTASGGVAGTSTGGSSGSVSTDAGVDASDGGGGAASKKWLRSFAIKYSNTKAQPADETAKFDLLITTGGHSTIWAENGKNSWLSLKARNPQLQVVLYQMGPGAYRTDPPGGNPPKLNGDWDWIKANHGIGSGDRWTGHGYASLNSYLQCKVHSSERAMYVGAANWRKYWFEQLYDGFFATNAQQGADGVFVDLGGYEVAEGSVWRTEDTLTDDNSGDYFTGSAYDMAKYRTHMQQFYDEAIPYLTTKGKIAASNFGYADTHPEYWTDLDARPAPPAMAMQESGTIKRYGTFTFNVNNIKTKLDTFAGMKNVVVLNATHGDEADYAETGLARMDVVKSVGPGSGTTTMTGWEALWFGIATHMATVNQARDSAYLGFTLWNYGEYHWFDEFDPQYLHLGNPVADRFIQDGAVYREFDDGWVVANTTLADLKALKVPTGQARVITHANFKSSNSAPLVGTFDLPLHRGIVLLKPGKLIGEG